jgi:uncharacterized membrane protein
VNVALLLLFFSVVGFCFVHLAKHNIKKKVCVCFFFVLFLRSLYLSLCGGVYVVRVCACKVARHYP